MHHSSSLSFWWMESLTAVAGFDWSLGADIMTGELLLTHSRTFAILSFHSLLCLTFS